MSKLSNKLSNESKQAKPAKPIVKVPKGKIGRAVFAGSQIAAALGTARAIRDARARGDRLALLRGALTAANLLVAALIAIRTVRAANAETAATDSAEPPLPATADR